MPSKLELALCVSDALVDVFDIHTGMHLRNVQTPCGQLCALHDSLFLALHSSQPQLSAHNHRFGRFKWKCLLRESRLTSLAVSFTRRSAGIHGMGSDPRFLCVGSDNGNIYCWCLLSGRLIKVFKAHLQRIGVLAFSPDGARLVSCADDCVVKVWKLSSIVMAPDTPRHSVAVGNKSSGVSSIREEFQWKDHSQPATGVVCDGSRLFTCARDGSLNMYSLLSGKRVASMAFPHPLTCMGADPCLSSLVLGSSHGELYRIDLVRHPKLAGDVQHIVESIPETLLSDVVLKKGQGKGQGQEKETEEEEEERVVAVNHLDVSYDGRLCVTAHSDGKACVWDLEFGSMVRVLDKHRGNYSQVVLICDRLGALSQRPHNESTKAVPADIKYEKFSLLHKSWPPVCKRVCEDVALLGKATGNDDDDLALVLPPNEMGVYLPSAIVSAAELALTDDQKNIAPNAGCMDHRGFLKEIDEEFDTVVSSADFGLSEQSLCDSSGGPLPAMLLAENRRLKAEIEKWRDLHQSLFRFTCDKVLDTVGDL